MATVTSALRQSYHLNETRQTQRRGISCWKSTAFKSLISSSLAQVVHRQKACLKEIHHHHRSEPTCSVNVSIIILCSLSLCSNRYWTCLPVSSSFLGSTEQTSALLLKVGKWDTTSVKNRRTIIAPEIKSMAKNERHKLIIFKLGGINSLHTTREHIAKKHDAHKNTRSIRVHKNKSQTHKYHISNPVIFPILRMVRHYLIFVTVL